jgi:diguanylate cyclase (GGDEF)-like protein
LDALAVTPRTRAPDPAAPVERASLRRRQVEILYEQSLWSLPGGLAAALALAAVLWPAAPRGPLLVWLGTMVLLTTVRLLLTVRYRRRPPAAPGERRWLRAYVTGSMLSALVWAGGAILVAPAASLTHWGAYLLWLGGLVAGGVATLSVVMGAYLAFALPAVLPVSAWLLLGPEAQPYQQTVGLILPLFLAFMVAAAWRVNRAMVRALRLQFENQQLNLHLRADLERHVHVEAQLREAKRRLEALARELRQLSAEDGLTGIANRRHFDQVLLREWRRAIRGRYPLTLVLLDLDYFKDFNDRYGHPAGDQCLKEVGRVLRAHCRRPGDVAARYGGEEFAVILPGTGPEDAREIAAHVCANVETLAIPHDRSKSGTVVTVSAGVASVIPDRAGDPSHLIELADGALYRAKGAGRNRVCVAADSPRHRFARA